jgi:hypothetical protein
VCEKTQKMSIKTNQRLVETTKEFIDEIVVHQTIFVFEFCSFQPSLVFSDLMMTVVVPPQRSSQNPV